MPTSILWIIFIFIGVMMFFSVILSRRFQFSYTKHYKQTSVYFFLASLTVVGGYSHWFQKVLVPFQVVPWVILLGLFILNPLTYSFSRKRLKRPVGFIERNNNQNFIKLDDRYLVSKTFEILFQQTCVIVLVSLLAQAGFSILTIMLWFSLLFGAAHLPLFLIHRRVWASYYLVFSILSGCIFPPLILQVPSGFVYSFILHWLFYTASGVGFWVYFNRQGNKQPDPTSLIS